MTAEEKMTDESRIKANHENVVKNALKRAKRKKVEQTPQEKLTALQKKNISQTHFWWGCNLERNHIRHSDVQPTSKAKDS
jgi:hypothetical protein